MKARSFTVSCFLFVLFIVSGQALMAQDSLNVTLNGHRWAYGPVKATAMSGDSILCVAYGGYLQLYDVTAPASPVEAGKIALPRPLHSMVNYSTGSAGYIIGVDGWGVQIIDVTDPSAPKLEKPVKTDGYSFDVDTLGSYCMVADGTNGLIVIDLSDPANASATGAKLESSKITRSVAVYRDTVYAACIDPDFIGTNNQIQIVTHAPLDPSPLNRIAIFKGVNFPLDIAAGATTFDGSPATGLFIADSTRLLVVDVADLSGVKGSKTVHGIADVIAMNGTDVYVGTRGTDYNLKMFDVSAPAAIPDPDSVSHSGILKHITFFDDGANGHLYLSLQYGGALYCADDLTGDSYFVDKEDAGHLQAVAVAGNFVFVADSNDGVRRLDISDQTSIFQTHVTNSVDYNDCQANDLKVSDDTLYVASGSGGLKRFHAADLSFIDEISTSGKAYAVDLLDGLAYIADGNEGLYIVEIANPLTKKGSWGFADVSHKAVDVKVWRNQILSKTYVFIAVEHAGLWIVDVSNPASPVKVNSLPLTGVLSLDVDVLGHYAYIASGATGFHVIDIRNLSNPQIASTMSTRSAAHDIEVRSSYVYVADGTGGLSVYLIDDKNNPVEIGYYDTGFLANGISVLDDENIFLTDGDDGLYIFDNVLGHLNYFNETYDDLTGDDDYILPSGRSVPVVVQSAKIVRYNAAGQAVINDLAAGDEFAIFDNQGGPNEMKMVGRKKYHGIYPFTVTVWMQYQESTTGTTVPGAIQGHPMIFKVWDASENRELGAYPVFTYGSGEFDETSMMTIVNPLTAVNLEFFNVTMPTGDYITVHISNDIKYNNNPIETGDEIVILDAQQNRVVGGAVYEGTSFSVPVWMERDNGLPGARPANRLAFKAYLRTYGKMFVAIPTYAGGASEANFTDDVWVSALRMYETDKNQQIRLEEDKINLISFYVNPEINGQPDISTMLNQVVYQNTALCQDDRGNTYIIGSGINEIGPVDFKKGYQVYFDDEGTPATSQVIGIEGYGVNAADYTHSLQDLQMIGYPYEKRYWAQDVFSAIVTAQSLFVIQGDSEGEVWIKDTANGININYFDSYGGTGLAPGNGYLVYVNTPMSYTYPAAAGMTGSMGKAGPVKEQPPVVRLLSSHFSYTETGMQYPVVITASQTDLNNGDEVALFDGDICVGAGVFQEAFPLLVSAWKRVETEKISLPGYQDGHEIGIRIWDSLQGEEKIMEVLGEGSEQPKFGEGLYAACRIGQIRTHIDDAELPEEFRLDRNYPNPFNPDTWIQYQLPEQMEVSLVIYNSKGQRVRVLVDEIKNAGRHRVKWDARDSRGRRVTSGVYIMKINAGKYRSAQKMLLIQ